jgi:hypothetical protein
VRILYSADPAALHQFSEEERAGYPEEIEPVGCAPGHLLCMQKEAKISIIRYSL